MNNEQKIGYFSLTIGFCIIFSLNMFKVVRTDLFIGMVFFMVLGLGFLYLDYKNEIKKSTREEKDK